VIVPEKVPVIEGTVCPFLSLLCATVSRIVRIVIPGSARVKRTNRLTPRGLEVVCLVADAMRNQVTAHMLNLSEHTVRNYPLRIFDKLGISSRVELVLYAFSGVEGVAAPVTSKAFSASA
jgi:DNA-binding CsgD family transcriptional regulator